jgi:hypothetical protein
VIPPVAAESVEEMLEAGAEGAVVAFADDGVMRDFARRLDRVFTHTIGEARAHLTISASAHLDMGLWL